MKWTFSFILPVAAARRLEVEAQTTPPPAKKKKVKRTLALPHSAFCSLLCCVLGDKSRLPSSSGGWEAEPFPPGKSAESRADLEVLNQAHAARSLSAAPNKSGHIGACAAQPVETFAGGARRDPVGELPRTPTLMRLSFDKHN